VSVSPDEFVTTKGMYFDLESVRTDRDGWHTAVAVRLRGVVGTRATGDREQVYHLLIDVTGIRHTLPTVWVLDPADRDIHHVNVFRARTVCPMTGTRLPSLCWGTTPRAWTRVGASERSLPNLLEAARQVLSSANLASRAR
jgi:hypothetical protein